MDVDIEITDVDGDVTTTRRIEIHDSSETAVSGIIHQFMEAVFGDE